MLIDEIVNPKAARNETGAGQNQVAWWHWHRKLYDWVIHWADTRHATAALCLLSFSESSFFPAPPDVLLAAMSLGVPRKWFFFAALCSLASVIGGGGEDKLLRFSRGVGCKPVGKILFGRGVDRLEGREDQARD